jgi:hypothetical protein
MAATWQSFAHAATKLGVDVVVTKPSGTQTGDLLVALVNTTGGTDVSTPSGWTLIDGVGFSYYLFTKVADGSEPAQYTVAVAGASANTIAVIVRVQGALSVDATAKVTGTGSLVIPSLTSAGAGRLLLQLVTILNGNVTLTAPGTAFEDHDAQTAVNAGTSASGTETVGAGATGTRTWTKSGGADKGVAVMLAIAPAPAKSGTFTGAYDFTSSGFTGDAPVVPPEEGTFTGGFDFTGTSFVGVAGEPSSYGAFTGEFDFSSTGFTGVAPSDDELILVEGTEGGRRRFGGRK